MLESNDWSRRSNIRTRDARRTVLHASDVGPDEIRTLLDQKTEPFWLDIDSAVPEHIALLADVFGFHPLAIEDALNPRTRVKLEEYDGYLFVVLRAMRFDSEKPFDGRELAVKKLCLFIGSNYLVSVHAGASSSLGVALARFEQEPELIRARRPRSPRPPRLRRCCRCIFSHFISRRRWRGSSGTRRHGSARPPHVR